MKNLILIFIALLTGCSTLGFGDFNEKQVEFKIDRVEKTDELTSGKIPIKFTYQPLIGGKHEVFLAGDFNIKENAEVFKPLYENGFIAGLKNTKTTLKRKCKLGNYLSHPIDNMYLSTDKFIIIKSAVVDFIKKCGLLLKARKISDHLPVSLTIQLK